ncbi:hypothetical protein NDU88_011202 [Pleurodeles waltl]|uniref:Uncharacterized protein n=1 Tax=Pleurodeles waltl TaxID=8319 RepID=A0AAV7QXY1_PLEWA|nr:hypothetical protein NDU88_011202 [Pleurodeles waltl]
MMVGRSTILKTTTMKMKFSKKTRKFMADTSSVQAQHPRVLRGSMGSSWSSMLYGGAVRYRLEGELRKRAELYHKGGDLGRAQLRQEHAP